MIGTVLSERGKLLLEDFPALSALHKYDRRNVNEMIKVVEDCAEFNRRYAASVALKIDERIGRDPDYFDWEIVKAGCKYRFLSLPIPKGVGGTAG